MTRAAALAAALALVACGDTTAADAEAVARDARLRLDACRQNVEMLKSLNDPGTPEGRARRRKADRICDEMSALANTMDRIAQNQADMQ